MPVKALLVALLLVAPGCDRDWAQPNKNTRATESGQPASAQQFDPTGLVCSDSRLEPFCERLCKMTSTSDAQELTEFFGESLPTGFIRYLGRLQLTNGGTLIITCVPEGAAGDVRTHARYHPPIRTGDAATAISAEGIPVILRAEAVGEASSQPAVIEFKVQSHWSERRLLLAIIGHESRLLVYWPLPAEITESYKEKIGPGKDHPSVQLFRGVEYPPPRQWGGAMQPPPKGEAAVAGELICEPMDVRPRPPGGRTVSITMRNLRFASDQIESIGPLEVQLDVPVMP
ncbi:MAG: hypothetical protein GVY24_06380 [Planctomycetes bacterium]|jgi:hypothetical protein|nr:hypothetical protein [Planctomycetota bacterium]